MKLRSNQQPTKITKFIVIGAALTVIIISNPFAAYASPPEPAPSASPVILDSDRQAVKERRRPLRAKREEHELQRRKACLARSESSNRVLH